MRSCHVFYSTDLDHDMVQADDRRTAEAHYKLALTLHFLEDLEKALQHPPMSRLL